jgi:hypothetical protein
VAVRNSESGQSRCGSSRSNNASRRRERWHRPKMMAVSPNRGWLCRPTEDGYRAHGETEQRTRASCVRGGVLKKLFARATPQNTRSWMWVGRRVGGWVCQRVHERVSQRMTARMRVRWVGGRIDGTRRTHVPAATPSITPATSASNACRANTVYANPDPRTCCSRFPAPFSTNPATRTPPRRAHPHPNQPQSPTEDSPAITSDGSRNKPRERNPHPRPPRPTPPNGVELRLWQKDRAVPRRRRKRTRKKYDKERDKKQVKAGQLLRRSKRTNLDCPWPVTVQQRPAEHVHHTWRTPPAACTTASLISKDGGKANERRTADKPDLINGECYIFGTGQPSQHVGWACKACRSNGFKVCPPDDSRVSHRLTILTVQNKCCQWHAMCGGAAITRITSPSTKGQHNEHSPRKPPTDLDRLADDPPG